MTVSKNKQNKSVEEVVATNPTMKANNVEVAGPVVTLIPTRVYSQPLIDIQSLMLEEKTDMDILVDILKIAVDNVDESKLPLDRCTDSELNKRLSVVYSKKVPAKKAKEFEFMAWLRATAEPDHELTAEETTKRDELIALLKTRVASADKVYDDLLALEEEIKSYKNTQSNRAGTLNSDDADPSKLTQFDLGKLIRNYQSKKSTAKKAMESATEAEELLKQKDLVQYWQDKVDDASKYRTTSDAGKKVVATNSKVATIITGLEAGEQTPEVIAMIAQLKALL